MWSIIFMVSVMEAMSEPELRKRRRWNVRRRMAKTAFWAGLLFPLPCYYEPQLIQLAVPFYSFVTGIIVIYIGSATYDDANGPQLG